MVNELQKKIDQIMDSKTDKQKLAALFSEVSQKLHDPEKS